MTSQTPEGSRPDGDDARPRPITKPLWRSGADSRRPDRTKGEGLSFESIATKPGVKTTELWLALVSAGSIFEVVGRDGGLDLNQAIGCVAIASVSAAYSIARALAKR